MQALYTCGMSHSCDVGTRIHMHITSGTPICTQVVVAVKVAPMPLHHMIPALLLGGETGAVFTTVLYV